MIFVKGVSVLPSHVVLTPAVTRVGLMLIKTRGGGHGQVALFLFTLFILEGTKPMIHVAHLA